ncbi:hypothetical protein HY491_04300 [Candidatus Woesearchaeota archaeon]|nr:hypothetical protein [Candidatus Woesearchaeota archaeon]
MSTTFINATYLFFPMFSGKRGASAQVSMEYVMIFAFILLIIIPTAYVFRDYIRESTDSITINKIGRIARAIADTGREAYFTGPPFKSVITIEFPEQIGSMYVLDSRESQSPEYFLMFNVLTATGTQTLFFESDVPIQCYTSASNLCLEDTTLHEQCRVPGFHCSAFEARDYSPGLKRMKIEANANCRFSEQVTATCVRLDEISDELT